MHFRFVKVKTLLNNAFKRNSLLHSMISWLQINAVKVWRHTRGCSHREYIMFHTGMSDAHIGLVFITFGPLSWIASECWFTHRQLSICQFQYRDGTVFSGTLWNIQHWCTGCAVVIAWTYEMGDNAERVTFGNFNSKSIGQIHHFPITGMWRWHWS